MPTQDKYFIAKNEKWKMKKRKMPRIKTPLVNAEEKHKQIVDFCLIVKNFFPKEIITNNQHEYYQELIQSLNQDDQQMIHLLVHHLTKLFQNHRIIRNKRIVEIAEEDILTALAITGNLLNPEAFLTRIQRQHFIQLQLAFKSQIFTSKQAQKALLISKSHSNRILKLLADQKLLQLIKRKDKHAFLHQIVFGKTTKS